MKKICYLRFCATTGMYFNKGKLGSSYVYLISEKKSISLFTSANCNYLTKKLPMLE